MSNRSRFAFVLLAACAFIAQPHTVSAAQGVALAWNHCFGAAGAAQNAAFACDTNAGAHVMTGSFRLDQAYPHVIGMEIIIDLASDSPVLPDWWQFKNDGTCRQTSMAANFVPDVSDLVCDDWGAGLQIGGVGGYCTAQLVGGCGVPGQAPNTARIKLIEAVAPLDQQDLLANQDYFSFHVVFNHQKTVGSGSCAGCDVPVCIVLNSINVVEQGNVSHRFLSSPIAPSSNFVSWQGGGNPANGGAIGCPAATATRRSTWGNVKSMYR